MAFIIYDKKSNYLHAVLQTNVYTNAGIMEIADSHVCVQSPDCWNVVDGELVEKVHSTLSLYGEARVNEPIWLVADPVPKENLIRVWNESGKLVTKWITTPVEAWEFTVDRPSVVEAKLLNEGDCMSHVFRFVVEG